MPLNHKSRDSRQLRSVSRHFPFAIESARHKLRHAARVLAPALLALSFAGVAHAQGTMDFSGAQTLMSTFKNFALDRQVEPLVLESEISGLADLHAYMKYQNYVTRFSFPYFDMPVVASGFEKRERVDDELPYKPKSGRTTPPSPTELKQVPEHSVSSHDDAFDAADNENLEVVDEPEIPEIDETQNLILRG